MTTLTDNFNSGTAGDNVGTRTGWSEFVGTRRVIIGDDSTDIGVSGDAGGSGSGRGGAYFDTGDADHASQAVLKKLSVFHVSLVVRYVDKDNYVGLMLRGTGGGGARLVKVVSDTISDLDTMQGVVGDTYRVEAVTNGSNTDYSVYVNGSGTASLTGTVANSEISGTNQNAGLANRTDTGGNSVVYWDDYYGEPLSAPAAAGIRNPFYGPLSMRSPI